MTRRVRLYMVTVVVIIALASLKIFQIGLTFISGDCSGMVERVSQYGV